MTMEDQTQPDSKTVTHERKTGTFIKWLIIGIAGIIIIAGGLTGGLLYIKHVSKGTENQKSGKSSVGILWPMEPFVVNLADSTGDRYLKAVIQIEVSDQENTATLDQLKPKFRDSILDILSSKSYKELMEVSGKQRLREDIAFKLNSLLSKGRIMRVYFTEFVIQ